MDRNSIKIFGTTSAAIRAARAAGLYVALGACSTSATQGGSGAYAADDACHSDADCQVLGATDVCSRDGACVAASQVRTVHISWTLQGSAANATTCAPAPSLAITFYNSLLNQPSFGFAPVPCGEGLFTIDKLPNKYFKVGLRRDGDSEEGASAVIVGSNAILSLPY